MMQQNFSLSSQNILFQYEITNCMENILQRVVENHTNDNLYEVCNYDNQVADQINLNFNALNKEYENMEIQGSDETFLNQNVSFTTNITNSASCNGVSNVKSDNQLLMKKNSESKNYIDMFTLNFRKFNNDRVFGPFTEMCCLGNKMGEKITLVSRSFENKSNCEESNSFISSNNTYFSGNSLPSHNAGIDIPCNSTTSNNILSDSESGIRFNQITKTCGHSDVKSLSVKQLFKSKLHKRRLQKQTKKSKSRNLLSFKNRDKNIDMSVLVAEILRRTHPQLRLNMSMCQRIEMFFRDIIFRIGDEAEALLLLSNKKCFTPQVLKYAIKLCLEQMKNEADIVAGRKISWML